jgi:hypothetical protein
VRILFIGDIVGRPGRRSLKSLLPGLIEELKADFVVANGENAAGGIGITEKTAREILEAQVDVITTGNHVWNNKEAQKLLDSEQRVLRPANYPPGVPGRGAGIFETRAGQRLAIMNLMGRLFMSPIDCPFQKAQELAPALRGEVDTIVVDMHAEATAEKQAMAWFLDGQVSAVVGTHTHVPTADEQILPGGTAYITDVGMTGPKSSVLGVQIEEALRLFLKRMPVRIRVAKGPVVVQACLLNVEEKTGKAREITRIQREVDQTEQETNQETEQ